MNVRPSTAADRDAVHTVHERSVRELAAPEYREEVVGAWVSLEEEDSDDAERSDSQPENGYRVVAEVEPSDPDVVPDALDVAAAEQDAVVAGFGDVRFDPPEYLSEPADGGVRAVYVDPAFAEDGVGSTLLEALEGTAREEGLSSLGLLASVNARGFYEHHGYEVVAETTFQFGEDVEGPAVEMLTEL